MKHADLTRPQNVRSESDEGAPFFGLSLRVAVNVAAQQEGSPRIAGNQRVVAQPFFLKGANRKARDVLDLRLFKSSSLRA
ncbi:MAG: hypothetical protein AN484_27730 [Aphanizomenon flos-aquae WA102]|uniref:Uncharacterized protein n=1 Tax=Aphanizomenon flos-aquae WA102 TaxID=1710896 RepID=A0A1B7W6B6_APHFL|nr:MAG: hypothetical protein AN484_27730 [Aphanizomenon flos-aquae WA102]